MQPARPLAPSREVTTTRFGATRQPVEQVSWDDCQRFLARQRHAHPARYARLPIEAEWENACRAGTVTLFYLGPNITPDEVNYDGNYPCAGAPEGIH
ncbi:MAG: SUMF1/EgtB/PvdO family nonheme iron enzyme [Polyangiaceae bacterium]|nr:SUMF1/EgtB/PvdO family nonheme iron enzyme [Polyangiaceae bacterium]